MFTIDEVADLIIRLNGLLASAHQKIEVLEAENAKLKSIVREPDKPKNQEGN